MLRSENIAEPTLFLGPLTSHTVAWRGFSSNHCGPRVRWVDDTTVSMLFGCEATLPTNLQLELLEEPIHHTH